WIQEAGKRFLNAPGLPAVPENVGPPFVQSLAGSWNEFRNFVTPGNAMIGAAMVAQPELTPYLIPAMMAPMVSTMPEEARRVFSGKATPAEGGRLALKVAALGAPFVHAGTEAAYGPEYAPPAPPGLPPIYTRIMDRLTGRERQAAHQDLTALDPLSWVRKYGVPEDLTAKPENVFYQPGPRGFVAEKEGPLPQASEAPTPTAPGEEPVVRHAGFDYRYDPVVDRWQAVDADGVPFEVIRPEEGSDQDKLVKSNLV